MTVVVPASAPAPAALPVVAHVPASQNGGRGFSAALDALTTGEDKAKSTDDGEKRAAEDAADAALARPSADLRAALMGGTLASLSMTSTPVADAASPVHSPRGAAPSPLSGSVPDAPARVGGEVGWAPAAAKSVLGATVTAERAYIAPAGFVNALDGAARDAAPAAAAEAEPQGRVISAGGATAPIQRGAGIVSTAPIAATAAPPGNATPAVSPADGRPLGPASASAAGVSPPETTPVAPPAATPSPSVRDQGATKPTASLALAASTSGTPAVEPQQSAGGTALPRSARSFARAAATAHPAGAGSDQRAASAATTSEAKAEPGDAAKPGAAGGHDANASLQSGASTIPAGAATVLAAAAQAGAASSTPSASLASSASLAPSATTTAHTNAPTAAVPAAARVREIDLDLSPGGVAEASMTVRLAGDRLGVVIRAASGETAATIEGARDAIAERLAAIGQPVSSIVIQQTDASDATGGSGQSTSEGEGRAPQSHNGQAGDSRGSRRGASRF